ncbi:hypothetical protein VBD025_02500 [Virgibacillus flavescens]|uniref:hypothetical protein n=1 Tax=Virgibacillus flavescens TaxID=1611422 RepID=UPI003D348CD0
MSTLFSFVPIILLILIVGFVVMINKVVTMKKKKYISGQKIRWVLGIYITVLLISTALYYLIPTNSDSSEDVVDRSFPYLSEKIYNGSTDKLDEKFITKQWNLEYDESTLRINGGGSDQGGSVFVKEKSEDDNQIDVFLYQTPSYVEGMEITDKINPPYVNLSSGNLTISNTKETNLEYTTFRSEFTISQFTGGDSMNLDNSYTRGERILIIKIPKGLKLQEENGIRFEYLQ